MLKHFLYTYVLFLVLLLVMAVKMGTGLINANPVIYQKKERRVRVAPCDSDEYAVEPVDQQEIFDILYD